MRPWACGVALMSVLSCVPARPPCQDCMVPEVMLTWTAADGSLVSGTEGPVPLENLVSGCARRTHFTLRNVGRREARVTISVDSPFITVERAPEVLPSGDQSALDLMTTVRDGAIQRVEATLTVDVEGQAPLRFELLALVFQGDIDLPHSFDFGGVAVGATRSLQGPILEGLSGDFAMRGAELQFSPRVAGRQSATANYVSLHDCVLGRVMVVGDGVPAVLTGPAAVDFGDVTVGTAAELEVALTTFSFEPLNVALSPLGVGFTILSPPSGLVATRDASGALVPGALPLRLRFAPTLAGPTAQELAVTAGPNTLLVPVRGVAVP